MKKKAECPPVDALFRLSLNAFVGARDALAAQLRKAGDIAGADGVKALAKPNLPAWVVNRLYWDYRPDFDLLLRAGTRLRAVQQRGPRGGPAGELQNAMRERSDAVAGLLRRAEIVLAEAGRPAAPASLKRVETTLEAIAALGGAGAEARLGTLTRDLEPPGFDALLTATAPPPPQPAPAATQSKPPKLPEPPGPRPRSPRPRVLRPIPNEPGPSIPEAAELALPRAQARVAEAVERLEGCRRTAAEAEAARAAAAAGARRAVAEVSRSKRRLTLAEKQADQADVGLKRAQARKQMADEELERARETLAAARAAAGRSRLGP